MTRHARLRSAIVAPLLAASLLASAVTGAQTADPQTITAAHALFDSAIAEMEAGAYESACKKLEEVTRLLPQALGAKLDLGECYEKTNRLASAWAQFMTVNDIAQRDGEFERARQAGQRAEALRPRLATLSLDVAKGVREIPGISITRDGSPLGEAQWGTPLPMDAGTHVIVAKAPGYEPFEKRIEGVTDGAKVEVLIEKLVRDPNAAAKAAAGAVAPIVLQAPPNVAWQRPTGIVLAGVGGATLVAGLIMGGLAISTKNESNDAGYCDERNQCTPTGLALRQQAVSMGDASTGLVIAGAALATGGSLLWALVPKDASSAPKDEKAKSTSIRVGVEVFPGGLGVRGVF